MDSAEAIEALRTSDLPEPEKQRLIKLIEDKGWNKGSQEEILSTIRSAAAATASELGVVTRKIDAYEAQVAAEDRQLRDEALTEMDRAATDFKAGMAKLEMEADLLGARGDFKTDAAELAREADEFLARAKKALEYGPDGRPRPVRGSD